MQGWNLETEIENFDERARKNRSPINIYRETSCYLNDTAAQSMQLALGRGVKEGGSRISFICPIRSVIPPPRSLFLFGRIAQVYSGGVNDASYWPRRMRVENTRWIGSVTAERRRALQPAPGSSKARKEERRGGVFFGFT